MADKETKRMKLKVLEVKERQPVGDKGAIKLAFQAESEMGKLWFFTFSSRLFEAIEAAVDKVIEADVEISSRVYEENTYIDRKIVQIYVNGEPVMTRGRGQYGKSPEEVKSIERQVCLKGAIELAVAKLMPIKDIQNKAQEFYVWLTEKPISTDSKTTKAPESKGVKTEEIFEEDKTKEHTPGSIDIDRLKDQLKELRWAEKTFTSWLVAQGREQNWGVIDISGTLTETVGKLNAGQREFIAKKMQELLDLRGD